MFLFYFHNKSIRHSVRNLHSSHFTHCPGQIQWKADDSLLPQKKKNNECHIEGENVHQGKQQVKFRAKYMKTHDWIL